MGKNANTLFGGPNPVLNRVQIYYYYILGSPNSPNLSKIIQSSEWLDLHHDWGNKIILLGVSVQTKIDFNLSTAMVSFAFKHKWHVMQTNAQLETIDSIFCFPFDF